MKIFTLKMLAVVMFMMAISMNLNAQNEPNNSTINKETTEFSVLDNRHELDFGIGFISNFPNYCNAAIYPWFHISDPIGDLLAFTFTTFSPSFNISYDYRVNKVFAIGASVASDLEWFHSAMINMKFYYVSHPKFSLYGNLDLGASLCVNQFSDTKTTPQLFPNVGIYPLGLKFGNKGGGFIEVGYGYKGILNFGGFVKF